MYGWAFPQLALGSGPQSFLATVVAIVTAGGVVIAVVKNGLDLVPYVRPPKAQSSLGLTVRMAPQPLSSPLDRRGWIRKSRGLRIFLLAYAALFALGGLFAMVVGATESIPGHRSLIGSMVRFGPLA